MPTRKGLANIFLVEIFYIAIQTHTNTHGNSNTIDSIGICGCVGVLLLFGLEIEQHGNGRNAYWCVLVIYVLRECVRAQK